MDYKDDEMARTAEELKASVSAGAAANVDDILGEIMDRNGSYSPEYSDMINKYDALTESDAPQGYQGPQTAGTGRAFPRRDYSAEAEAAVAAQRRAEMRIKRKMAPSVRGTVAQESQDYQRPEFTYDGSVRYPSYGVGESGERVIYDADWESQAKEEASKIGRTHGAEPPRPERAPTAQFRFTGADEAVKRSSAETPRNQKHGSGADAYRRLPEEQEQAMEIKQASNDYFGLQRSGVPVGKPAAQEPAAQEPAPDEETRGLSPEAQRTVDNAVLEAFSSDFDSDAAFKEKWKDTVEKAQRRKELKAKQAQEEEARMRSQQKLEEQERRVARMEQALERTPPPPQRGVFTPVPPVAAAPAPQRQEPQPRPEASYAERLDDSASAQANLYGGDSTVKKSKEEQQEFRKKTKQGRFSRFVHNNFPCPGDSGRQIARKLIMDISFVALVGALIYLAFYFVNYRAERKTEDENYNYYSQAKDVPEAELPSAWEEIKANYPDVEFPEGMNYAFAQLYALNQDTVGYLTIHENGADEDEFRIRTVLLQTQAENGDYYLKRNFYKKTSRYGHPYVHKNCNMGPDGLSKNTLIYGHNTHDHLIFNRLEDYMTKDGYLGAPVITLDTLYGTTKWKIFAVMLTNADEADDNGRIFEYQQAEYASESAFLEKMEQIKKRSMIHTGVDVQAGDRTLMLYTCYRKYFDSGRLVIVARQLREGESETINTSQVYECKNTAIFPAAYYKGSRKNIETTAEPTTQPRAADPTPGGTTEPTVQEPTVDIPDTLPTLPTEPVEEPGGQEQPATTPEPPSPDAEPAPDPAG